MSDTLRFSSTDGCCGPPLRPVQFAPTFLDIVFSLLSHCALRQWFRGEKVKKSQKNTSFWTKFAVLKRLCSEAFFAKSTSTTGTKFRRSIRY
jgi:hypothetical protein